MKSRSFAILTVLWAFGGVPVLCMAGALEHPCECDDQHSGGERTFDQPITETTPKQENECSHESQCHSDPCSVAVTHKHRIGHDPSSLTLLFTSLFICDTNNHSTSLAVQSALPSSEIQTSLGSPLPGVLPLLI